MGVPISRLVCASNANDILTRLFATGTMAIHEVVPTLSPSMDIQVSSNLERLLFELSGRDGAAVAELLTAFRDAGTVDLPADLLAPLGETWKAASVDDDRTRAVIAEVAERCDVVVDPHTAVGLAAAADHRGDPSVPMVTMATAHPAKFGDAVAAATGEPPELPDRLARLADLPEHYEVLPADLDTVRAHVRAQSRI